MIGGLNNTEGKYGISPVVGVILMVAITVMLAAIVATVMLDLGSQQQEFVSAGVAVDIVNNHPDAPSGSSGDYILISVINTGNTDRIWVQGDSTDKWLIQDGDTCTYETKAGDYLLFPVPQDEGFTIYAERSDGTLQVIQTEHPQSSGDTSGSYLTGCGYGDEDRGTLYSEFHGDS